jgi:hypothetical protein
MVEVIGKKLKVVEFLLQVNCQFKNNKLEKKVKKVLFHYIYLTALNQRYVIYQVFSNQLCNSLLKKL